MALPLIISVVLTLAARSSSSYPAPPPSSPSAAHTTTPAPAGSSPTSCSANISIGLQLGTHYPTTHCGANCTTSTTCCDLCAASARCRAFVWRKGDPETQTLNSCKMLRSVPDTVRHWPGDSNIASGIMPEPPAPVPPAPVPSPPCPSYSTNATCSSSGPSPFASRLPRCAWNTTTHACVPAPLPCGITKQKAIYLRHTFDPPIEDSPATDISTEVSLVGQTDTALFACI
jgi:hypothetical protein